MYVCVRFIGTTHFKIGSVLREEDAAGSRETIRGQIHLVKVCALKVGGGFRHSPAQVASVISVNNMRSVSLTFASSVLCVTTSHGAFVC